MSDHENESRSPSPSPVETNTVDYTSEEIHDEVECMLAGDNKEIIELISTDPKYYLGIVENYKNMRDGKEIYLPDLFNVIISKSDTAMNIKFKMSDNSQWHEVGFNGGEFVEDDVYKAFTEKVNHVIKHPPMSRRAFLEETMQPNIDRPPPMINQGNQNKLSKIDRFLGRTDHAFSNDTTCSITPKNSTHPETIKTENVDKPKTPVSAKNLNSEVTSELVTNDSLLQRLNTIKCNCPETLTSDYCKLLKILTSKSQFITELLSLTNDVDRSRANLIYQFLMNSPVD